MTVEVDIFTLGFFIVTIILVSFLVPMIWQAKKTIQNADNFLSELHRELLPAVSDLREITDRINRNSAKLEKEVDKVENLLDSLEDISTSIRSVSNCVESAGYFMLGLKAATKVFLQGSKEKETSS